LWKKKSSGKNPETEFRKVKKTLAGGVEFARWCAENRLGGKRNGGKKGWQREPTNVRPGKMGGEKQKKKLNIIRKSRNQKKKKWPKRVPFN